MNIPKGISVLRVCGSGVRGRFCGFMVAALAVIALSFFSCGNDDTINDIVNVEIEMVQIPPAGTSAPFTFTMGSPEGEAAVELDRGEQPQRIVTLTGFRMGKYLVTQGQFRAVMKKIPAVFRAGLHYQTEQIFLMV